MSTHTASTQRSVALSAIDVRKGFNPRSQLDQKALDALTRSIEHRGVLQPLIVCPRSDQDGDVLVAGQRRYAACCALGLMEGPVIAGAAASRCAFRRAMPVPGEPAAVDVIASVHAYRAELGRCFEWDARIEASLLAVWPTCIVGRGGRSGPGTGVRGASLARTLARTAS